MVHACRLLRSDAITPEEEDIIVEFWNRKEISRDGVMKRDKIGKRGKLRFELQRKYLEVTQTEAYLRFKDVHADLAKKVHQRRFEQCKPWYIYPTLRKDRIVCACQMHVNVREMFHGISKYRKKMEREERIVGPYSATLPEKLSVLVDSIVCGVPKKQWSTCEDITWKKACADGTCEECGVEELDQYMREFIEAEGDMPKVKFSRFQSETRPHPKEQGKTMTRTVEKTIELAPMDFLKEWKEKMRAYVKHLHVMKWQAMQFQECLSTFRPGNVVIAMEFAEN